MHGVVDASLLVVGGRSTTALTEGKLRRVVIESAGETEAPMLRRGLPTEVAVINGGVVERARTLGIEAPRTARIVDLL